jgi:hypothetical protein
LANVLAKQRRERGDVGTIVRVDEPLQHRSLVVRRVSARDHSNLRSGRRDRRVARALQRAVRGCHAHVEEGGRLIRRPPLDVPEQEHGALLRG